MATRFVYMPIDDKPYVKAIPIEFLWEPGMSLAQKERSSLNLHRRIINSGIAKRVLECSRASKKDIGHKLSAFNLEYHGEPRMSLENFYQGIKVLKDTRTGELINMNPLFKGTPMNAKVEGSKRRPDMILYGYKLPQEDKVYKTEDSINLYNYNYIKSVIYKLPEEDKIELLGYDAFTDIMLAWYGGRVTACQAHALATMKGLILAGKTGDAMVSIEDYIKVVGRV